MSVQIGERILQLMKKENFSQKELAQVVGVTEAAMSRYLRNEREPKADVIANLATALDTTSDYLIRGEEDVAGFEGIYRLVARGSRNMSRDEKVELVRLLLKDE